MLGRCGRAKCSHSKIYSMAGQRDRVHVALDDNELFDAAQSLPGLVEPVEFTALVKQDGLRGVKIFGLAVAERAAAESDRATPSVANREHDAIAEAIVMLPVVLANDQSGGKQLFRRLVRLAKLVEYVAPAIGRIADAETLGRRTVNSALFHVLHGSWRFFETGLPVSRHRVEQREQFVVTASRFVAFAAGHIHAHRGGQALDSLNEAHVVEFHEEANRRAVGAAAKAMIEAFSGAHGERGRLLIMKRAACLEFAAGFLELHATADYLDDVGACDKVVDKVLRN